MCMDPLSSSPFKKEKTQNAFCKITYFTFIYMYLASFSYSMFIRRFKIIVLKNRNTTLT